VTSDSEQQRAEAIRARYRDVFAAVLIEGGTS
jgi:hypothetical protein